LIVGVGVDSVLTRRVAALLAHHGESVEGRVFTPGEVAYCRGKADPSQHLAARFAAKEAVMKALGRGIGQGAAFSEIEVVSDGKERPRVALSGGTEAIARRMGVSSIHLSLTHTSDHGIAFVVLEGGAP